MDAGSLADVHRRAGSFPESVTADFGTQLVQGLLHLHRDKYQVHRDIKPANMLCERSGRVRLSDFGIAAELSDTMGQCDTFLGTARYMAPETLAGKPYSYPADVWSLGICLYEFAVGKYPYANFQSHWELLDAMQAQAPPRLPVGEYSEEFCDFVARCLEMDPGARSKIEDLAQHPFVNNTMAEIIRQQTVVWIAEVLEKYKTRRSSGGSSASVGEGAVSSLEMRMSRGMDLGSQSVGAPPLEEEGEEEEVDDYQEESFDDYNPSPSNSASSPELVMAN